MSHVRPTVADRARGWRRRLRALLRPSSTRQQTSAELAFHLDMETQHNIASGMRPDDARRAAVLAFGGVDRFTEDVRDVRNISWIEDLAQDLRHAARAFRRAPGFTAAAVGALALGLGANSAVFSVLYGIVIAPLPYSEPDRLVRLWEGSQTQRVERGTVSPGTFSDLRTRSRALERIALYGDRSFVVSAGDETWEAHAGSVSPALFEMLGARPVVGRFFPRDDGPEKYDGRLDEVVLSYELWQRHFGGARDVIGRTLMVDARWPYTIVGVAPRGFSFPVGSEVWMPLLYDRTVSAAERQFRYYSAIGQLRRGHSLDDALRETSAITTQLATEYPASNAGWTVDMIPLADSIVGKTKATLIVVFALAACVLLVACGNVATLAVARATSRRHETAVRLALGAGQRRLLRQWLTEGMLLAAVGGVSGVVVAYWSTQGLIALAPRDVPRLAEVAFSAPVVIFAVGVTCLTGLAIGLAPALRARDTQLIDAMRTRTAGATAAGTRSRAWLVGGQVALTLVLIVAATLLLRSFARLHSTDLGFQRHDVLSAEIHIPAGRFPGKGGWYRRVLYYDELMAELRRMPGVRAVAGTTNIPLTGELGSGSMWRTDAPGAHGGHPPTSAADQWKALIQIVTPGYFAAMGVPVTSGRDFQTTDRASESVIADLESPRPSGVAIVNEAMAKRFWPNESPLGKTIVVFDDLSFAAYRTIVGVVRDVRVESVAEPAAPSVFLPFAEHPGRGLSLVLKSTLPPEQLVRSVTNRLRAFDSAISIRHVRPLDRVVDGSLARPRFTMLLVAGFAALALAIAAVGVFGIVGFLVARRRHEIGIRMALGARTANVLWLVLSEGLRPVVLGVALGAVGAVVVARSMRALLYGVTPLDAVSFGISAVLLLAASVLAAVIPARRATGIDPIRSLRSE